MSWHYRFGLYSLRMVSWLKSYWYSFDFVTQLSFNGCQKLLQEGTATLPLPSVPHWNKRLLGADHLIFEGGGEGWKISKNNFLQSKEKEKKISCSIQSRKKYIMQKRALKKKFLHVNYWRSSLQYCVYRLARFCIFEQVHVLKRTRVNSGQHHRDSTAFEAYNIG
jgi:hypothetical protein